MTKPKLSEIQNIIEDGSHDGWCTYCEEWTHDCCEPDARKYECPVCENRTCYGAEECLIMGLVDLSDDDDDDYGDE